MRVAIYARPNKGQTLDSAIQLIQLLEKAKIHWNVSDKLAELLARAGMQMPTNAVFLPEMGLPPETDFVCSIGGDGTILEAVSFSAQRGIPVAGVHTGRLGFLATISYGGLEDLVRRIKAGDYILEERSLVQLVDERNLFDGRNFALNEVAIMKRDTGSMITVHTFLNGKYLNSYWADGLIISTPTGSTGYSLSCGGPIVLPHSDSFIITPVSPHNLNVRPLVIPDSAVITCTVEGRGKKALLSLDTRSRAIDMDSSFSVRKETFSAKLLRLPQDDFTDTLRNKLYWGADLRN
jgi:NAD+ kinase